MATITTQQAIQYAKAAGFTGQALINIVAIAWAESGLDTTAYNGAVRATGILQISLTYHPDVSAAQANDPAFSFKYAYQLSSAGLNFCPWQSWSGAGCKGTGWNNSYAAFIPRVKDALGTTQNTLPSAQDVLNAANNTVKKAKNTFSLASNASVAMALQSFDNALTVNNPLDVDTSSIQDNVLGVSFTDPVQWIGQVGLNIINDIVAIVLRTILIALGVYVLFKVLNHFIDFTGAVQNATNAATKLAPLLVGA